MKRIWMFLLCSVMVCFTACGSGGNGGNGGTVVPPATSLGEYTFQEREIQMVGQTYTDGLITYPDSLWATPEYEYCTDLDFGGVGDVKGLFITSPVRYNGKQTKIAAYIGFPENASAENKVPAIVLVHGGLGTAVPDWVKYWNDMGFAAISIDTEGGEPINGVNNYSTVHKEKNRYENDVTYTNGPTNVGFSDYDKEMENQWMYHATSATIVATSLIASFDCVDIQKIGITGISWGGMITSIVCGYDDRLSFGIPVYGALSLTDSCSGFRTIYGNEISAQRWDTLEPLQQSDCKMFYVNGIADAAFSMDASSRSAKAAKGFALYKKGFTHGQEYGAYESNLPFFAKYFCGMESEYVEIVQHPNRVDSSVTYRTYGEVEVASVKVHYTSAPRTDKEAVWKTKTLKLVDGVTSYAFNVPEGTTYYYVQITYNTNLEVSSYIVEI